MSMSPGLNLIKLLGAYIGAYLGADLGAHLGAYLGAISVGILELEVGLLKLGTLIRA